MPLDQTTVRKHRAVYRHQQLKRLYSPTSIAVVGASPNTDSFGTRTIARLKRDYQGNVYPVNPKYSRIDEDHCYASIAALPAQVDCVVIALPLEAVESAVLECVGQNVGGVMIYASGYAETGRTDRIQMQDRLSRISREHGIRILGPNCLGYFNFAIKAGVSFTRSDIKIDAFRNGGIGLVSQSGAMAFAQSQGAYRGVSISHVIASGNSCDVDVADTVAYLAEDPSCRSIVCIFEGHSAPEQIIEAGEIAWNNDKPLIVCKLGVGETGARVALSHSGSLAGSLDGWEAAFRRAGIIMLDEIDGLLETAAFFAKVPRRPSGRGVAAVGISGGALVATADKADAYGIPMPQPREDVQKKLESRVPEFGAARNPCDATAMASRDIHMIPDCVEALASDDQYCTVLYPQTSLIAKSVEELRLISEACAKQGKPATTVWLNGWLGGPGMKEAEADPNMAVFYSMSRYFWTLREWFRRDDQRREWEKAGPRRVSRLSPTDAKASASLIISASPNRALTEREAKEALACYGIPVVSERLVHSAEDAVFAAQSMNFPVVLKVESPQLPHKTEADVVRLNLKTADEVRRAYQEVLSNAERACPSAHINGVLVQSMVPRGTEVMVGGKVDSLFGPMIIVGLGGVLVELIKDTAVELAPLTKQDALHMLDRLKGRALFDGFRGAKPVPTENLAEIIVRLAEFISDQSELIEEFDVNPLICTGPSIIAVDALIVRSGTQNT